MIDVQQFQYERTVRAAGTAIVQVAADGAMWAHAARDFADLRVVDARGREVPWQLPDLPPDADLNVPLRVIDSGRRGALAIARVRTPRSADRVTLVVPDTRFVGVATVYGSDDRQTWTSIGSTQIYSVGGATPARSAAVLLRPNDYPYLEIRATSVSSITGVGVRESHPADLVRVPAKVRTVEGREVVVDLGYARVPIDELRISSTTRRYDRPFTVLSHGVAVASGRLVRLSGPGVTVASVDAEGRLIRIAIANGDDPPLRGLRVTAWARQRPVLIESGRRGPLTLYYGGHVGPPSYDFARLPVQGTVHREVLGVEHANPAYRVVDRRSFFTKHTALVTAALALAAALLVAAGALALRRT